MLNKELIEELQKLPPDMEVKQYSGGTYLFDFKVVKTDNLSHGLNQNLQMSKEYILLKYNN